MITIVCPTYNEAKHIESILRFFVSAKPLDKELFIVDGGSTDGTTEIIKNWSRKYPNIFLLYNPYRYVPYALNIGIKKSTGNPIIRIDAHAEYAHDYFEKILQTFEKTDADIVGGATRTASKNNLQAAIAAAISNKFGTGNSKVHDENFRGYVDSVTFGAWKREIFSEVGYFDEELLRNQDDEFHYRAKSNGKKIYLNPDIKLWYYPRDTFKSLFKQYFQYGYYKPLVLKKVIPETKLRHLAPSFFVIYLLSLPVAIITKFWLLPLLFYVLLLVYFSVTTKGQFFIKVLSLLVYPIIHIAYGSGFIIGLLKLKIVSSK